MLVRLASHRQARVALLSLVGVSTLTVAALGAGCGSGTTGSTAAGGTTSATSATGTGPSATTGTNTSGTGTTTTAVTGASATSTTSATSSTSTGGGPACMITLTGAVQKTIPCTVSAGYDSSNGTSGVPILSTTSVMGAPEASVAFKAPTDLMVQTYNWSMSTQGGAVLEGGASAWLFDSKTGKGSSTVTFSSLNVTMMNGTMKIYNAHGTVTATLVPAQGAGAGVNMSVTF